MFHSKMVPLIFGRGNEIFCLFWKDLWAVLFKNTGSDTIQSLYGRASKKYSRDLLFPLCTFLKYALSHTSRINVRYIRPTNLPKKKKSTI